MKTDVLVIGGGIAGAATAYYLATEGVDVTLVEADDLNTQASGANAGSIHVQIQHPEFVSLGPDWARAYGPTLRLLIESQQMWLGLGAELGVDLDVSLGGGLLVATTPEQMRQIEAKAEIERSFGVPIEILDRDSLRTLAPYLAETAIGAGFCPIEGKANPLKATPAFAAAAERRGASMLTRTRILGLEPTSGGYRVRTGERTIEARRIVNAAGAAAADIAAMLGITIALQGVPLQVTVTEPVAPLIPHLVYSAAGKLSLKQAHNGSCLIGGGWHARRLADGRLVTNPAHLAGNMTNAANLVPTLGQARAVRSWTATVNGTEDWRPIIGEVPGHKGFFLSLFPWVGFSAGPITARLTADMILGRQPRLPLNGVSALF
ncbi:FAD-binding oxidoreductase [Hoeflea alexandrii]|uniref:NAD(P)/FAD-dependent oxidoreductase n=1 Tax=Hoeflea alexandrii TaxID=288436 RepID=UPI0035CE9025